MIEKYNAEFVALHLLTNSLSFSQKNLSNETVSTKKLLENLEQKFNL